MSSTGKRWKNTKENIRRKTKSVFYILQFDIDYCWVPGGCEYAHKRCPVHGTRAVGRKDGANMTVMMAKGIVPIIHTSWRLACTDYALHALRKAGVTGWELRPEPVKVRRRGVRRNIPTYHEIEITGRGGSILHNEGVRILEECPHCGAKRYTCPTNGIHIAPNQWDGSDIFSVKERRGIFLVTEKFAEVVRRKRFRGLSLIPATEWIDPLAHLDPPAPAPPESTTAVVKMLREKARKKGKQT